MADNLEDLKKLFKYGARKLSETRRRRPIGPSPEEISRNNLFEALHQKTQMSPFFVSGDPEEAGRLSPERLLRLKGYKPVPHGNQGVNIGVPVLDLLPGHRMQLVKEGVVTPEEMGLLEEAGRGGS